jgi:hypothetical protein
MICKECLYYEPVSKKINRRCCDLENQHCPYSIEEHKDENGKAIEDSIYFGLIITSNI